MITYKGSDERFFDGVDVNVEPFRKTTLEKKNDVIQVTFDDPFPPNEKANVSIVTTRKETITEESVGYSRSEQGEVWLRTEALPATSMPMSLIRKKK